MEDYTELLNQQIFAIDTVWVALCAALIFFMEAGFALLEAGFVRSKNAMSIIAKVIIDITFGGIAFFIVGFGIAYGSSNGWFAIDFGIMYKDLGLGLTVSNNLFWFIQLGFAIAAISIVSGALAERMKLFSYAILLFFSAL
jgi:Amt family ammonium transporter